MIIHYKAVQWCM